MPDQPDFLCVGAQKAATSWLYVTLKHLPGVYMCAVKESHYFTPFDWSDWRRLNQVEKRREAYRRRTDMTDDYRAYIQAQLDHCDIENVDDDWYRGIFAFAKPGELRGEICPSYFALREENIAHVNRINPEARIVMLLRDPVERCWSHMRMHKREKGDEFHFEEAFQDPNLMHMFLASTAYNQAIPRWQKGVGDRLAMFLFDDVLEQPEAMMRRFLDHIGYTRPVDHDCAQDPVNVGDPTPLPEQYRLDLYERLQPQYDFLESLFPERVSEWRLRYEHPARIAG